MIKSYKTRKKDILKQFVEGQKSYKLAIKNYDKYKKLYTGTRYTDVPKDIRDAVAKVWLPVNKLMSKSAEMKVIISWLSTDDIFRAIPTNYNKNIRRTLKNIQGVLGMYRTNLYHVTMVSRDDNKYTIDIPAKSKEEAIEKVYNILTDKGWDVYEYKVLDITVINK